MKYVVTFLVVLLTAALGLFALQNTQLMAVRFITFESSYVPLYVIILASALVGILMIFLLGLPGRIQQRFENRRLTKQVVELEKQVAELKSRLPQPVMKPLPDEKPAAPQRAV